jgi:hypothetical protein
MNISSLSIHPLGIVLVGAIGLALILLSLRAAAAGKGSRFAGPGLRPSGRGLHSDLERLFSDISRGLRFLTSPARAGGFLYREKQEEIGRQLAELQSRLRLLEDPDRRKYEGKAGRILEEAAQVGITLPPP